MSPSSPVTNADIFLWALFELGGADDFVDVEDVFFRAFEVAPQRLSWRTRDDIPDLKKCSKGLRDAEARQPRALVRNGADYRKLSVEGQQWIEDNFDWLADSLARSKTVRPPRQRRSSRLVSSTRRSAVFKEWRDTRSIPAERWVMAELLNCSPDSATAIWTRRLEELRSLAYSAGEAELLDFLDAVRRDHKDWFSNG